MSHPLAQDEHARAKSRWTILLVVGLCCLAAVALLGGSFLSGSIGGKRLPVLENDRDRLLTIVDFEPYLPGYVFRTDAETITKTRFLDHTVQLEYEYQPREALYVRHRLVLCDTLDAANSRYEQETTSLAAAARSIGPTAKVESQQNWFDWADASSYFVVRDQGSVVAIHFACQIGQRVIAFRSEGLSLNNANFLRQEAVNYLNTMRPD